MCFGGLLQEFIPYTNVLEHSPYSYLVSRFQGLKFRSLVHLELIFIYGEMVVFNLILLHINIQFWHEDFIV